MELTSGRHNVNKTFEGHVRLSEQGREAQSKHYERLRSRRDQFPSIVLGQQKQTKAAKGQSCFIWLCRLR